MDLTKENELIYQVKNSFAEACADLEDDVQAQFHMYKDGLYICMEGHQIELNVNTVVELVKLLNHRYGEYIK